MTSTGNRDESPGASRLLIVDAARGFAVTAMIIAHTAPFLKPAPRGVGLAQSLLNDVAAPLFALVIGLTVAVTAAPPGTATAQRRRYRVQTAIRAGALIAIGLLLDIRFSGVTVVLQHLGVTMLAMLPFLFMRTRPLLAWGAAFLVVGPAVVTWCRIYGIPMLSPNSPLAVRAVLDWIVLGRSYQALTLLPLALIGIVIGRTILRQRRAMTILLAASVAGFLTVQLWIALDLPGRSLRGGYVEAWREAPLALGALAAIVLLTDLAPDRVLRMTVPPARAVAVMGTMSLSVYVLHVLILMGLYSVQPTAAESLAFWRVQPRGWLAQIGLVLVCWIFAAAWWRWMGTGPVERVLGVVSGRHRPATLLHRRPHVPASR